MKSEKDTSWNKVADWYDDLLESGGDSYQEKVIAPNLLRLITPKTGMKILDLASGQGFFSRKFAAAGAEVIGVDSSEKLVEMARRRAAGDSVAPRLRFEVSDAGKIPFIKDGSMDAVAIVLALQNIKDVAGVFAESARVLRAGGTLVFVLNHPAFRIPKQSSWGFDEKTKTQFRRVDEYLSELSAEIEMHPGAPAAESRAGAHTLSFHRPLQFYFKALEKSGLVVARLEEWISHKKSEPGPRAAAENKTRKEFPLFLAMVAVKTA